MKLYGISRRKRGTKKVKMITAGNITDVKIEQDKRVTDILCQLLNNTYGPDYEYVVVEFAGD